MIAHQRVTDATSITGRMEETPEGFLICRDVPLARTGEQIYNAFEVPRLPPKNGQVIAQRDEDQVFHPDAIESFRGKPLTDDHPDDDVTTANFKQHLIGTVMSPRRGEGAFAHCVVGDLIVYDPGAIAKIKAGKRELSCGYDADYESIEPGRARQINIRGNHVSLVDEGRCGPACAIRDKRIHQMAEAAKPSWKDRLFKALRATDDAEREEHLAAAEAGMPGDDHDGDGHHITLNIGTPPGGDVPTIKPKDAEGGEGDPEKGKDMDEDKVKELCGAAIDEKLSPITSALEAITSKLDAMSSKVDEAGDKADAVAEALDDLVPEDMEMQDAVARAEILAPGIQTPSRDAKPGTKAHRDAVGNFQRAALKSALDTDFGRMAVGAVLGHAQPHRIGTMDAKEVAVAFRAASTLMAGANTSTSAATLSSATAGFIRDNKGQRVRPMTTADLAQIHRDHYAKKTA